VPQLKSSRDVIIRTPQHEEALTFYREVLGFTLLGGGGMPGFETGSFRLYVEAGAPPQGPVFDFLVADVAAARDRLVAAGCTLIEENPRVPRCYLRDPYGMVFNLGLKDGG
jgi:catechol 2,3-dioxygenase-like lactoylglutathione lyase family enzyme